MAPPVDDVDDPKTQHIWIAEEQARLLINSVRDYAIFMVSPTGLIETWNAGAESIKGYRAQEIIGQPLACFYTEQDVAAGKPRRLLDTAAATGQVEDAGWRVRRGGSLFWADVMISAIRDADGSLLGFSNVTRDLTERRNAEAALHQSEQRLRLLINSVRDYAIFMVSPTGLIETWNAGAESIKGYRAQEIIGQPLARFYTEQDVAAGKPRSLLDTAAATGQVEDEGWRVRKDGSLFWADVVISAIRDADGSLLGFSKVTRDLTEHRNAEAARMKLLQTQQEILLREERERQLQRTGEFRERLLGIVSHDLRSPLSALSLGATALLRAADLPPRLHKGVRRILASGDRMSRMVADLLDFTSSRLGEGIPVAPEPMDMAAVCGGVIEEIEQARPDVSIRFHSQGNSRGRWDPGRVAQVVSNLITNACRHGDPARPITVSLTGEGENVVLGVHNFGEPIPAELSPYLFSPFRQGQTHQGGGQREGLGLGLYIVEQIVHTHGGTVVVASAPEEGTTFTVHWPRRPAGSPPR